MGQNRDSKLIPLFPIMMKNFVFAKWILRIGHHKINEKLEYIPEIEATYVGSSENILRKVYIIRDYAINELNK